MSYITVQPAQMSNGVLPYPFHVAEDGRIGRQDFWRGKPVRVLGFVAKFDDMRVDLWWKDAVKEPERAVGMYLITQDADFTISTHRQPIETMRVTDGELDLPQQEAPPAKRAPARKRASAKKS